MITQSYLTGLITKVVSSDYRIIEEMQEISTSLQENMYGDLTNEKKIPQQFLISIETC